MEDDQPAPAVGLLRVDLAGASAEFDRAHIASRAVRLGYTLIARVLEYTETTPHRTEQLLALIYTHRVEAIIVPTLTHLDEGAFELILPTADIITTQPYKTYARRWTLVRVQEKWPLI